MLMRMNLKHHIAQFKRYIRAIVETARIEFGSPVFRKALEEFSEYENEPVSLPCNFTYSDPSDHSLKELRDTYGLDEIAGSGDEITESSPRLLRLPPNAITPEDVIPVLAPSAMAFSI